MSVLNVNNINDDDINSERDSDTKYNDIILNVNKCDFDCPLCFSLLYEPITLECGHTFCRDCTHLTFKIKKHCPICRKYSNIDPNNCSTNVLICNILEKYTKKYYLKRSKQINAIKKQRKYRYPIYISNTYYYFPFVKTNIHIYEQKYRIMVDRVLRTDKKFIITHMNNKNINPINNNNIDYNALHIGTLCTIDDVAYLPDGRSMIKFTGIKRVKLNNIEVELNCFGLLSSFIQDYKDMDMDSLNKLKQQIPPNPINIGINPHPINNKIQSSQSFNTLLNLLEQFITSEKIEKNAFYNKFGVPPKNINDFTLWISGTVPIKLTESGNVNYGISNLQQNIYKSKNVYDRLEMGIKLVRLCIKTSEKRSKVQFWIIIVIMILVIIYEFIDGYKKK